MQSLLTQKTLLQTVGRKGLSADGNAARYSAGRGQPRRSLGQSTPKRGLGQAFSNDAPARNVGYSHMGQLGTIYKFAMCGFTKPDKKALCSGCRSHENRCRSLLQLGLELTGAAA